jgi:hypothetical protein
VLWLVRDGFETLAIPTLQLSRTPGETLEFELQALDHRPPENKGPSGVPGAPGTPMTQTIPSTPYPGLRVPSPEGIAAEARSEPQPDVSANFAPALDRWDVSMPEWERYERQPNTPYVRGHWYDPFNRNKIKGDYPIFGQRWFLDFTGRSETGVDAGRLPLPSGLDAVNAGSAGFFGRGEQSFASENLRLSFDLFRGDTSFRPVDFRVRFTPEINLNFLQARERAVTQWRCENACCSR